MAEIESVTVTIASDLLRDIDRCADDRSQFIAEAVRRELDRQRRAELERSLENPHPESTDFAALGFEEWSRALCEQDADALVDITAGIPVRWAPGEGWAENPE